MHFDVYAKPNTIEECLSIRARYGSGGRFIAGGTDLIPRLRTGRLSADAIVDITGVAALRACETRLSGELFVGAAVRLSEIQHEPRFAGTQYDILSVCAGHVSSMAVRNIGTIGGNACNASPCADSVPALLMLDALAVIRGPQGQRQIPVEEFFVGPGITALKEDELLEGFLIPAAQPGVRSWYNKYSVRGDSDIAIIGTGASVMLDRDGRVERARLAVSSAAPVPLRVKSAEALLVGRLPEKGLLCEAAMACADACVPISDHRASAEYRKKMIRYWMEETLKKVTA